MQIFLRAGQMAELDKIRTELMNGSAITVQRFFRGYLARKDYVKRKQAVITLQVFPRLFFCIQSQQWALIFEHADTDAQVSIKYLETIVYSDMFRIILGDFRHSRSWFCGLYFMLLSFLWRWLMRESPPNSSVSSCISPNFSNSV